MEYEKCLVQLDEVIKYISYDDLKKIPNEIKEAIKAKKDSNYFWKYDENKPLNEQNLDRKTIAMLSYLNMEYLLNEDQKELMEKIHRLNQEKLEKNKQDKYKSEDIFDNGYEAKKIENVALIEVKEENWFKKMVLFIKNLFNKNE